MNPSHERLAAALSDRYTIEKEVGAGGMATVFLAVDVKHGRKVALKVLRPNSRPRWAARLVTNR